MLSYDNRCKDRSPSDTVRDAREIISKLGLFTSERWFTPISGLYSIHLSVIGTSIYSNGKGSTPEYALASAYGELLERLQNLAFYRISRYAEYYKTIFPFKVAKDEMITEDLRELEEQEKYFRMVLDQAEFDECISAWKSIYSNTPIINTRFRNLLNPSDEILVPELVFGIYYGSNGMAGGNTYAEAFVQALSEVFERYAVKRIFIEKLTPPDITHYAMTTFPSINKIIREIEEENGGISIQIKDINLGMGLPVFAAVYIDKNTSKYFVNLGCHPNACVAIERCLTELYQGQGSVKINNATCISEAIDNSARTLNSIFCTGEGAYPIQFFGKSESYNKLDIENLLFASNADMADYYINIISNLGFNIYYQDAGFLGFPAVSVVVPGMSEAIYNPSDAEVIKGTAQYVHFLKNYQSIDLMDKGELGSFAHFLENYHHSPSTSINEILRVPIDPNNNPHFDDITIDLILAMIYIRLQEYSQAKKHLDAFIRYMQESNVDQYVLQYNLIISSILRCRINGIDDAKIAEYLSDYFPVDEIASCISDIAPDSIFNDLPKCICPDCARCEYLRSCHFIRDNEIANKLLERKLRYDDNSSMLARIRQ